MATRILTLLLISAALLNAEGARAGAFCTLHGIDCIYGCTSMSAWNYDPNADYDNGTCRFPEEGGCTDLAASNWDAFTTWDDGSCIYVIRGCTSANAYKYDPEATEDDGSRIYPPPIVLGCTDVNAYNYNQDANEDDGSCEYENAIYGCMDPAATHYNPTANSRRSSTGAWTLTLPTTSRTRPIATLAPAS